MLRNLSLFVVVLVAASTAQADPIDVSLTTALSGTVPSSTITYTVAQTGGTARDVFGPGTTPNGIFNVTSDFNEFAATGGTMVTTITFSGEVSLDQIVFGYNSISPTTGNQYFVGLRGGTGVGTDIDLIDGLPANTGVSGTASYRGLSAANGSLTGISGVITPTAFDQGIMLGSTSSDTITSLIFSGIDNGDGYTEFFGFVNPAAVSAVPEPSSMALCGIAGVVGLVIARVRARRKTAAIA